MLIAEYEQHIIAMTLFLYIFQAKNLPPWLHFGGQVQHFNWLRALPKYPVRKQAD